MAFGRSFEVRDSPVNVPDDSWGDMVAHMHMWEFSKETRQGWQSQVTFTTDKGDVLQSAMERHSLTG